MSSNIESSWSRIVAWLESNAPEAAESIGPPVAEEQIAEAEQKLGFELPSELKALYRIAGLKPGHSELPSICLDRGDREDYPMYLLKVEEMLEEWSVWKDLTDIGEFEGQTPDHTDPGVVENWWNTHWVPFAADGGGGCFAIDMGPAEGGSVGQVISHCHEVGDHRVLAASLSAYLEYIADSMASGKYTYTEGEGLMLA